MPSPDTLDSPASQKNLLQLARNGLLDIHAYERGLKLIGFTPSPSKWNAFFAIVMLVLGAGFTVNGIYFFFAYNWAEMHRFVKLGIVEFLILLAVIAASIAGLDKLPGKITLTVAGVLIGALFAVFGQVYQTGADSYRLFLIWAVLMAGWVFISRFTSMWLIWVLLLNTTLLLYWDQIIGFNDTAYLPLFAINALFILAWEIGSALNIGWLISRWPPRLISLAVFYSLTAPVLILIERSNWGDSEPVLYTLTILFLLVNAMTIYFYSQKILDTFMLTLSAASLMIAFDTWMARLIDLGDFTVLFLGVLIIAQTALVVTLLLRISKSWEARAK